MSAGEVLAWSVTGILLVLLGLGLVFGGLALPSVPFESGTEVLTAVLLVGVLGVVTLLLAAGVPQRPRR